MAHYRKLLDPGKFIGPQDFPAPREVTISRVVREVIPARDGESATSAPMLYFKQKEGGEYARPFKVPKSVLYGLSEHLGTDYDAWADKAITIFSTKCMSFGDIEECLRIKFPERIDRKIIKWLKKRKSNEQAYMLKES